MTSLHYVEKKDTPIGISYYLFENTTNSHSKSLVRCTTAIPIKIDVEITCISKRSMTAIGIAL